jgi:hypothetical protein
LDKEKKREAQLAVQKAKDEKTVPAQGSRPNPYQSRIDEERQRRAEEAQANQVSIAESMKVNPVNRWIERFSARLGCASAASSI